MVFKGNEGHGPRGFQSRADGPSGLGAGRTNAGTPNGLHLLLLAACPRTRNPCPASFLDFGGLVLNSVFDPTEADVAERDVVFEDGTSQEDNPLGASLGPASSTGLLYEGAIQG